ncbi:MAG TPA: hypothetical protein VK858_12965, partial [Longimicrobiales bacterium]|nr:hypothetical protein [Longimicrobiales bacterium]
MNSRTGLSVAALAGLALWACADQSDPRLDPDLITGPAEARVPAECSTGDLAQSARSFFSNPEQRDIAELLRGIEDACAAGDGVGVVSGGWSILRTMETVLDAGRAGDTEDGTALANGLFGLMCDADADLCAFPPEPILPADLEEGGIFAVRAGGTEPIVGRGLVEFVDFEGEPNDALWLLVTTGASWSDATNSGGPILIYGHPSTFAAIPVDEVPFEDLAYELHSFPDVERFNDGEVHIGVCYGDDPSGEHGVGLPHVVAGDESTPERVNRIQR